MRGIGRVVDVRPGEGRPVAYAFGYFFCVLGSYYVLRPLREAMGIVGNVRALSRLFLVTLAATLVLTPVLAALVSRWPRRRFVPVVYRFFALNLIGFYALLAGGQPSAMVACAFFVWTSVFNLFALSLFWSVMADVFERAQGVRLFGLVAGGGTVGAMAGSFVTAVVAPRIGIGPLVLVSAGLLELAVWFARRLTSGVGLVTPESTPPSLAAGGTLRWLPAILKSPYLLAIIGYMLFFTFTSTSAYFEQARIVKAAVASHGARAALFARMDLAVNVLSLALSWLVASPLLRRFGVAVALIVLPVLSLVGFLLLGRFPSLEGLVIFQVLRRAVDYGIAKPSREVLFTSLPREDKYKAKTFIDTFVYRTGDAIGALAEGASATGIVLLCVPVCVAWAALARLLGRLHSGAGADVEASRGGGPPLTE